MGLFDTITIDKSLLPTPGLPENFVPSFQTKDIDEALMVFSVGTDRKLILTNKDSDWTPALVLNKLGPSDVYLFTGTVNFYTSLVDDSLRSPQKGDGWIEFRADFVDGEMVSIELVDLREDIRDVMDPRLRHQYRMEWGPKQDELTALRAELATLKEAAQSLALDVNRILSRTGQGTYDEDLSRSMLAVKKLLNIP